jgi:hypothetical protein
MELNDLKMQFPHNQIHWRVGATNADKSSGIALAYVDARDVMSRLDNVCGPENWQARYPFPGCCEIGINIAGGLVYQDGDLLEPKWVWKANGAGETNVEGEKGQYSDAFKRAGVLWGIAQYLYDVPTIWVALDGKKISEHEYKRLYESLKVKIPKDVKDRVFTDSMDFLAKGDADGLRDVWKEYDSDEKVILWGMFNSEHRKSMTAFMEE